jgi:hypothetical protein
MAFLYAAVLWCVLGTIALLVLKLRRSNRLGTG